ncbi:hypothetical protein QR98_0000450 [Sarcoptes scabiei]|uniref:Selenoprotein O n=1 Tax=Sarcoptes scabiei TaxID=52283 RepID=A0A131ZSG8_SARSC|nr:hypothetical protein QR98_0000450 [Sarcoptes scabiei]
MSNYIDRDGGGYGKSLINLNFDNQVLKNLPIDPIEDNSCRCVADACFSRVKPTPVLNPRLVCYSKSALALIDISHEAIDGNDFLIQCFSGNEILPGSETAAHCYCGHQFGVFAGQLGDGAAIYLGEIINQNQERWELQLKGAGLTPYSRSADGRKVLRSSLREFLCCEAMFHLGIPTTRSGSCIISDTKVERDQFYDGNPKLEPCAVITRLAPTFLRFGSFEIVKPFDNESERAGPSSGNEKIIQTMVDFTIKFYFPSIQILNVPRSERYRKFFEDIVIKTAKLVAKWQAYGFVHGVLNTDNMSILGLTLDYGPYGFIDRFDRDFIPNTSDTEGRYRYRKQPEICLWNLKKFSEVLAKLLPLNESEKVLNDFYYPTYQSEYIDLMLSKFGIVKKIPKGDHEELMNDEELIEKFLDVLEQTGADYTNSLRNLNILSLSNEENSFSELLNVLLEQSSKLDEMKKLYQQFFSSSFAFSTWWRTQIQNDYSNEDMQFFEKYASYQKLKEMDPKNFEEECRLKWIQWLMYYIDRLKFDIEEFRNDPEKVSEHESNKKKRMNEKNPLYILRNHLVQKAIEKIENDDDFGEARKLLKILENPYEANEDCLQYTLKPNLNDANQCIKVSCSS